MKELYRRTNAQLKFIYRILADSCSAADCSPVRQHSSKPNVSGGASILRNLDKFKLYQFVFHLATSLQV